MFLHRGPASTFGATLSAALLGWLPQSGEQLDDRPHFDRMPPGYDPAASDASEEIWLPLAD